MKISVCVKRVPATTTRVVVGDNNRIDPNGVEFITTRPARVATQTSGPPPKIKPANP